MYQLDEQNVKKWGSVQGSRYPNSFDMDCPFCDESVNFIASDPLVDTKRDTTSATARCTRCSETVHVWNVAEASISGVYMLPGPSSRRSHIEGLDKMPEEIQRAYQDTVAVFNAGVWNATVTMGRRTLEGLVQNLAPSANGPLAKQLEDLPNHVDLANPLITLSHSVRQGGNIGAHFDLQKSTDKETAAAALEMIEYFLWYIYVLPESINELDQKIENLGKGAQT